MKYLIIIKKMKKLIKSTSCLFIFLLAFSGCQSVKDGLTGKKQNNSDEFLVQKKNPLTLPPEFGKLPKPKNLNKDSENNESEIDLNKILTKDPSTVKTVDIEETSNGSLEKSILKKIKNN